MRPAVVRTDRDDMEAALRSLGVPPRVLQEAVHAGYVSRISRTPNDAPNAPGFYQWNETLRSLRDGMALHGWRRNDEGGWSTTVHPENKMAIAVASGNQNTGNAKATPANRSAKGPRTAEANSANVVQLLLFKDMEPPESATVSGPGRPTWFLIFSCDVNELRAELSLPVHMDEDGYVSAWVERIILPPLPLEPAVAATEPDFGPDVDIQIARRA